MVHVKLVLAFGFQVLGLFLDFLLFAVVALGLLLKCRSDGPGEPLAVVLWGTDRALMISPPTW